MLLCINVESILQFTIPHYRGTYFLHCLASFSVDPSANCFMLKSVPPADPSLHKPWIVANGKYYVLFLF